ncbi:MAG: PLP-dependent cysteine synthase family protein [Actinomycetia bacterium]|nr:PLP-dependent cysteine synthase family protein [Actinomycetes bacterium]
MVERTALPTSDNTGPVISGGGTSSIVGNTPLIFLPTTPADPGSGFWAKLEGHNPNGMKDRPALHMVERARDRGELHPGGMIVESSSGTMGLGLALAGIVYRHPVTVVTDAGLEPIVHQMLRAYGAVVDVVTEPHPVGGWQLARKDRVAEILAAQPGSWCPDQYANPDNVAAYHGLASELIDQLGDVDVLVCSVGTGGHSAGVSQFLRRHNPRMRLIGVDTIGSTIFGQPAAPRLMRGLGSSIYPGNVDYSGFDEVHWVAPGEAVASCRALAANHHASGGWSVGAVGLVAGWVARTSTPGERIVAIFPDGPMRYHGSIYDDDYCREHGLLGHVPQAHPDVIETSADRVVSRWTRCATVTDPICRSA